ncbi:MAG: right-handed parallel beta-helix repeat-containing protein [Verrucomicrobia bacterium]|nr:right-handed parallel beta-helix repeat-containing protein [Verrucomicrobiota bacterium]
MPRPGLCQFPRFAALVLNVVTLSARDFNVRDFGATGAGQTHDTAAINQAIEAAAAAGGGTVRFPAGSYLSFSIRLKSHITLQLDAGATLVAASPATDGGTYDPPEPNEWGDKQYQDFGHSHWHDSLIWGENLEDIAIVGHGRIFGKGLARGGGGGGGGGGRRGAAASGTGLPTRDASVPAAGQETRATPPPAPRAGGGGFGGGPGSGNKSIALKNCRNVTLRDISILQGGWFALLATGVDNLTIDGLRIDTNRDGLDIDSCRNVRIAHCTVNAPNYDAIVLKSSYALGTPRACENITITNCLVSGFDVGSVLDGTFQRTTERAPDRDGPTGRIKLGTESNGGFKNITIANCVFDRSRGLALETVDGGVIEDVAITNLTMRDVSNSPIFLRLGHRARGPEGTPVGALRRVTISHVVASNVDARYPILLAGLPGHPIEDVALSDIRVEFRGGLSLDDAAKQPADLVNTFFLRGPGLTGPRDPFNPPEQEKGYPEPSMFGLLPAYGMFVRHARGLTVDRLDLRFTKEDTRPAIVLLDVAGADFTRVRAQRSTGVPFFVLRDAKDFSASSCPGLPDTTLATADHRSL